MARNIDIVAGRNPVLEAMRGRRKVHRIYYAGGTADRGTAADILRTAKGMGIPAEEVERSRLEEISGIGGHQGFVAEVDPFRYADLKGMLADTSIKEEALILVLDGIEDPQNLGSLIRVAEGAGCNGLIVGRRRSSPVTTAVCKASAGAVEHLPVVRVANIAGVIESLKSEGVWIVGADSGGEVVHHQVDLTAPTALVLGSEGRGLRRLTREKCDILARIQLFGRIESLNVAAAGAVMLFEARRQREGGKE